jgi:hypothetical protein
MVEHQVHFNLCLEALRVDLHSSPLVRDANCLHSGYIPFILLKHPILSILNHNMMFNNFCKFICLKMHIRMGALATLWT